MIYIKGNEINRAIHELCAGLHIKYPIGGEASLKLEMEFRVSRDGDELKMTPLSLRSEAYQSHTSSGYIYIEPLNTNSEPWVIYEKDIGLTNFVDNALVGLLFETGPIKNVKMLGCGYSFDMSWSCKFT